MSDFRSRLHTEFTDLTIKVDKLKDFIVSEQYDKLPEIDRSDLKEAVKAHAGVLVSFDAPCLAPLWRCLIPMEKANLSQR